MERLNLILLFSWLFTIVASCKKSDFIPIEIRCNLEASEIKNLKNKTGTLAYYEVNHADSTYMTGYFILNHNVSEAGHLPIKICNFPKSEFPDLKHGDQLPISFEGRIVVLPENTDALNTDIELSAIKMTK